MNSNKRWQL